MTAPVLDRRTYDDVMRQLLDEARRRVPLWNPEAEDDLGHVLAVIYAHYVELLLARLNRVPDKHKLAFLDLMGVSLLPPGVARTPIVFTPGGTAGRLTSVGRGTQVATAQTETDPAVTFETDADLNVVDAALVNAFTIDPERDRYADRSPVVRGEDELTFNPFRGDRRLAHELYLGLPEDQPFLDAVEGRLIVELEVDAGSTTGFADLLEWSVHRGAWLPLNQPKEEASGLLVFESVHGPRAPLALAGDGLAAPLSRRWLRAAADLAGGEFPRVGRIGLLAQMRYRPEEVLAKISDDALNWERADPDTPFEPLTSGGMQLWLASAEFGPQRPRVHVCFEIQDGTFALPDGWTRYKVDWSYFDGSDWQPLGFFQIARTPQKQPESHTTAGLTDTTLGFSQTGWVSFRRPNDLDDGDPAGVGLTRRWIRAAASIAGEQQALDFQQVPTVNSIRTSRDFQAESAAVGTAPVDPTAPFQPFGAFPQRNDVVYIASREALSQRGAEVTIFMSFSPAGLPNPGPIEEMLSGATDGRFRLAWEYHGATGWQPLGDTVVTFGAVELSRARMVFTGTVSLAAAEFPFRDSTSTGIVDTTQGFRRNGEISFVVPSDVTEVEIAGLVSHWVRVRVAAGDYGRPLEFVIEPKTPTPEDRDRAERGEELPPEAETRIVPKLNTGNLAPPTIESVAFAYEYSSALRPTVVTRNTFHFADRTSENESQQGLDAVLLRGPEEEHATFYLGFDRELPNSAVNLYFAVPPRQLVERIAPPRARRVDSGDDAEGSPERLAWEYWNGASWARLVVVDDTNDLTEPGVVQFLGPVDFAERALFAEPPRRWLRIVLLNPDEDYAARLDGVFVNGVEAMQARTIQREVIGSSSGGANQRIRASSTPVLPGQQLWVREPELPPAEELRRIQAEEGDEAFEAGEEIWIRWHEVRSFVRSGPHDRHYLVNRILADFVFGNGERAVIPPAGVDNITVDYRSGGTDRGNRTAGAVSKLQTSIPVIESVTNPIPASGGSATETLAGVLERGPQTLKHRGRAITCEDYEWLARQASGTSVARARCIPTRSPELEFDPGWVTLIVVPAGREKKLLPSAELVRVVMRYLEQRVPAVLMAESPAHVNVIGPGYVPVELAIEINPVSFTEAEAVRERALAAIDSFLHPLTGGPEGTGWEFGRDVYLSEIFAALEQLPGVEHVHSLRFKPTAATVSYRIKEAPTTPLLAVALLTAQKTGGEVTVRVVEDVRDGDDDLMLTLFREGERIGLWPDRYTTRDPAVELSIRAISGDVLTVDRFRATVDYPLGTIVASMDGSSSSFLVAPIATGARVDTLRVELFGNREWLAGGAERLRIPDLHLPYSGNHTILASQN